MMSAIFQREALPLGEILKINLDIRVRTVALTAENACNGYQNE